MKRYTIVPVLKGDTFGLFGDGMSDFDTEKASELLVNMTLKKSKAYYAAKLNSLENGECLDAEVCSVAVVFCYEVPEKYTPSKDDREKNGKLIDAMTGVLHMSNVIGEDATHAIIAASVMLGRASWSEMLFCYEAATRLLENRKKSIADVCREMGMTEEEMER